MFRIHAHIYAEIPAQVVDTPDTSESSTGAHPPHLLLGSQRQVQTLVEVAVREIDLAGDVLGFLTVPDLCAWTGLGRLGRFPTAQHLDGRSGPPGTAFPPVAQDLTDHIEASTPHEHRWGVVRSGRQVLRPRRHPTWDIVPDVHLFVVATSRHGHSTFPTLVLAGLRYLVAPVRGITNKGTCVPAPRRPTAAPVRPVSRARVRGSRARDTVVHGGRGRGAHREPTADPGNIRTPPSGCRRPNTPRTNTTPPGRITSGQFVFEQVFEHE